MQKQVILAFDIGTSSTRTALFDLEGRRLKDSYAQQSYSLQNDATGRAELVPKLFLQANMKCLQKTISFFRRQFPDSKGQIVAVGASCFWHSFVGIDARGEAMTPIFTWADSRSAEVAAELRSQMDERKYHHQTGAMLRSSFWLPKMIWLQKEQPLLFKKVAFWLSPVDFLFSKLCTSWHPSFSMASGTGLFCRRTCDWDDRLLELAGLRRDQVGSISESVLVTSPTVARKFPELGEAQWFPPIGDGASSNLGCSADRPGRAALNFGTSAAIRVVSSAEMPDVPFGLFCYLVDRRRWLIGGAVSNAGNVRAWAERILTLPDNVSLERALAKHPEPIRHLTILPFLTAERAPTWSEEVPATIMGIQSNDDALSLFQALTEATYLRLGLIADLLQKSVVREPLSIIVSGGILKSRSSMQRLSNVLGHILWKNPEPEASLRGAAVFAIEQMGFVPSLLSVKKQYCFDPHIHMMYREMSRRQVALEEMQWGVSQFSR